MYRNGATPSTVRRLNERAVVHFLQSNRETTRATCAKALGMSQPTAGKIVDDLVSRGLIAEVAGDACPPQITGISPQMGRPGQMLRLDQTRPRFLLIQLGVRKTRLIAAPVGFPADVTGDESWAESFPTPSSAGAWRDGLLDAASRLPRRGLWATVISVPGVVDESAGRVLFSPNLHWTQSADIRAIAREVWRLPTMLVQEIRALALGHRQAEPADEDFLLVDFGSGVGAAAVLRGQLYSGALPLSGELGHTPVAGNSRRCGCGAIGCMETLVSRKGLLASFAESVDSPPPQPSPGVPGERARSALTASSKASRRCSQRAPNWPALTTLLSEERLSGPTGTGLRGALDAAAAAIAGALNVLGLKHAVITGSLTEIPAAVEYLSEAVVRGAMWSRFGAVMCAPAPRRRALGLVAAAIDRHLLADPAASIQGVTAS